MADPLPSRGVFARLGIVALIALFFLAPRLASADDIAWHCEPIATIEKDIQTAGGSAFTRVTDPQWQFVRGLYVAAPNTPSALPPGDYAMMSTFADGTAAVSFIDDGKSCAIAMLTKEIVAVVMGVGQGDVTHAKTPGQPL
jgi:hypothetical protein